MLKCHAEVQIRGALRRTVWLKSFAGINLWICRSERSPMILRKQRRSELRSSRPSQTKFHHYTARNVRCQQVTVACEWMPHTNTIYSGLVKVSVTRSNLIGGGTCFVRGRNLAEDKYLKTVQDQMTQCMSGFIEVGRL